MRQWKVIRQQYRRIALILSAVALCCLAGWKVAEVRQIRMYVPGGVFLMGDHSGVGFSDERPAHWVRVSPFHILANEDLLVRAVDDAIMENMQAEDEIDAEVEGLISQNVEEIRAMDMDVGALRNKMKREIARKRNFTL